MEEVHVDSKQSEETVETSKRKIEKTVLDNFSSLIKPQEAVRVKGGTNILKYLLENNNTEKVRLLHTFFC